MLDLDSACLKTNRTTFILTKLLSDASSFGTSFELSFPFYCCISKLKIQSPSRTWSRGLLHHKATILLLSYAHHRPIYWSFLGWVGGGRKRPIRYTHAVELSPSCCRNPWIFLGIPTIGSIVVPNNLLNNPVFQTFVWLLFHIFLIKISC